MGVENFPFFLSVGFGFKLETECKLEETSVFVVQPSDWKMYGTVMFAVVFFLVYGAFPTIFETGLE